MDEFLYKVNISTSPEIADALLEMAEVWNVSPSVWQNDQADVAQVDIFWENKADAECFAETVEAWLIQNAATGAFVVNIQSLPRENWAESWKKSFHVERVSPRVVIKPSWEDYDVVKGDCVVEIDPGMSFGTGAHGTTRACIQFLDELNASHAGDSVLDIGCGSGILSIAAAKLGFLTVTGFDNDPDAVRIAGENARHNGVDHLVAFSLGDLKDARSSERYDIVVANILANVIQQYAECIASMVSSKSTGSLIVSGILEDQYDGVIESFRKLGFSEQKSVLINEWKSGLLRK